MVTTASATASRSGQQLESDQRVFLHDVPWSHYEILLAVRGEAPVPRIAYLEGELELMSPSRQHEMIKSILRQLVEAYAAEVGIDLWPVGSWTVHSAPSERGAEPDECYTLGDPRHKEVPDLAIEVVWTSGGIDKHTIYRGLGVGEVWFWQDGRIQAFVRQGDAYAPVARSALMPGLDLDLVARLASMGPRQALAGLREELARRPGD
jgi:Uma2 family endonuclease